MSVFKSCLLAVTFFASFQSWIQACPGAGTSGGYVPRSSVVYSQPRYVTPVPQAAKRSTERTFVVCTQDNAGQWWVRQVTDSQQAAQQLKARFQANGQRAWAMEAFPVPDAKAKTFTLSNGEVAIALAISMGEDAHAVAIGPSGRAEALARQ